MNNMLIDAKSEYSRPLTCENVQCLIFYQADFACVYRLVDSVRGPGRSAAKQLQYAAEDMFQDEDSTLSTARAAWEYIDLPASLAGAVVTKRATLILARGKLVDALSPTHTHESTHTRHTSAVLDAAGTGAGAMAWERDLLSQYANTKGPLRGLRPGSMVCVPVCNGHGEVVGVVQVARAIDVCQNVQVSQGYPKPFCERQIHLLHHFAAILGGHLGAAQASVNVTDLDRTQIYSVPHQSVDTVPQLIKGANAELEQTAVALASAARFHCDNDHVLLHLLDERSLLFTSFYNASSYTSATSAGLAWRVMGEDSLMHVEYGTLRSVDATLYGHLNIIPMHNLCCALRQGNGKAFAVLEVIRCAPPGQHWKERARFSAKDMQQIHRLCQRAAGAVEASWRAHQLAAAVDYERKNLLFSLHSARTRTTEELVSVLSAELTRRMHTMLCQVYVLAGNKEVWTLVGREIITFPRKKAGVVSLLLQRHESACLASGPQAPKALMNNDTAADENCQDPMAIRNRIKTVAVLAVPVLVPVASKSKSPGLKHVKKDVIDCQPATEVELEGDREEEDEETDSDLEDSAAATQPIAVVVLTNRLDDKGKEFVGLPPAAPGALPLPTAVLTEHASRRLLAGDQGKSFHTRKESRPWKLHGEDRMLKSPSAQAPNKKVLRVTAFTARDLDLVTNLVLAAAASLDVSA
jgi:hypothetical protein